MIKKSEKKRVRKAKGKNREAWENKWGWEGEEDKGQTQRTEGQRGGRTDQRVEGNGADPIGIFPVHFLSWVLVSVTCCPLLFSPFNIPLFLYLFLPSFFFFPTITSLGRFILFIFTLPFFLFPPYPCPLHWATVSWKKKTRNVGQVRDRRM